jgi:hypothetical protein
MGYPDCFSDQLAVLFDAEFLFQALNIGFDGSYTDAAFGGNLGTAQALTQIRQNLDFAS